MMTPNLVTDILDDLIEAFKNEKVFKFVHLPVQSGDDRVLKLMRRFYPIQDFREIVDVFRAAFPEVTLATDIICGFPGETREAFVRDAFLESAEIKRRSTEAAKLVKQISLERNQRWTDWTGEVLIDEKGKVPSSWIGRNFAYKPVAVKSSENLLGKTLRVKIVKAFSTYLSGKIC